MVYFKSALAGLLALLIAAALLPTIGMLVLMIYAWLHPPPEGYAIGWDPIVLFRPTSLVHRLPLAVIVLVFALGFFWEFRRLRHR